MGEFPANPENNAVHSISNTTWKYNLNKDQWEVTLVAGWRIEEDVDNSLTWIYNDSKIMRLDVNGNLTVKGDITAFGNIT
jgi:hypothetical protein